MNNKQAKTKISKLISQRVKYIESLAEYIWENRAEIQGKADKCRFCLNPRDFLPADYLNKMSSDLFDSL